VVLDGLLDGQPYTYRVLSLSASAAVAGRFVAPPGPGSDFRFFMFGDTRTNADDHAAVITGMATQMASDGHDRVFVLHTGDFVTTGGVEGQWNTALGIEAPIISRMPVIGVFGNHEAVLGRTIFEGIFKAPPTSGGTDRWFTVEVGDLLLVVLDVYAPDLPEQIAWMERELARSPARFKILSLHVPLFTFSNHLPAFDLRDQLLPILQATGVQLVVNGHNHLYERFFGGGIHFVTAGGGGAPLYGTDDNPEADNTGATRRVSDSTLHYLAAEVAGPLLRIETFAVPDATRIDCFVIDADAPGAESGCVP
jgi:predicted phosphodiesterase